MLLNWVWSKHERGALMDVLDPRMQMIDGEVDTTIWRCILHVELKCCHPILEARPEMQEVLHTLQHGLVVPIEATRPAYPGAFIPHHPGLRDNEINSTTSTSTSSYSSSHYANSSGSHNNMSTIELSNKDIDHGLPNPQGNHSNVRESYGSQSPCLLGVNNFANS